MWPPTARPSVTAGFKWAPDMLNPAATIAATTKACVVPTNNNPSIGLAPPLSVHHRKQSEVFKTNPMIWYLSDFGIEHDLTRLQNDFKIM